MTRKITNGTVRNKERTKNKLIDSVGEIIAQEGFSCITVSNIARYVKHDKKLIYEYFGGGDELVKEYFNARNFGDLSPIEIKSTKNNSKSNSEKDRIYQLLENQFDSLIEDPEMRGVIAWELSEHRQQLKEQVREREESRKQLFNKENRDHGKDPDKNKQAIEAILMSSIYYLTLNAHKNGNTFNGIDLKKKKGQQEIKDAMKQILEWTYS
ncbi:TetR/AcrR family transcriptional regulator [Chryseobacterium viscerum]|uniref:TetR/AcrR family transcriptional regulator n=1 Tax=Chryseobacterium viscerum TaxID=1037377 RepID=UPI000CCDF6B1|nr:TetR/AcrR family transcriptional regulator [Chryseobacterium viscerum]